MSKKTQKKTLKKSSKAAAGKSASTKSATSAKTPAAKKRAKPASKAAGKSTAKVIPGSSKGAKKIAKAAVSAPAKTVTKTVTKTVSKSVAPKVSHQAPSKPLKSPVPVHVSHAVAPESTAAAKPKSNPPGSHTALSEGIKAPAFRLPRDGGETVSLADFAGRKLVLFFYPRADTPGCTKEAIDFTRLADAFGEIGTAILGVSADPLKAQEAFRDKHELAIPLVSDEQHEMLEAYGVWDEKSMYGRTFLGVLRTTVLIGTDGRVVRIWRHVKVDGHADEVLAAATAA